MFGEGELLQPFLKSFLWFGRVALPKIVVLGNAAGPIKALRGQGATGGLGSFSLSVQDVIDGLLRRGSCFVSAGEKIPQ